MEWQPSTPLSAEELARLPVFPLPRVVFFPGTALPLHLFEPRYTEMIEDCLDNGCTAMAVALLAPGWEDHYDGDPAIYEIAGAGRIVAHQRQPDGTHDVILHGLDRVRLHEFPNDPCRAPRGFWRRLVFRHPCHDGLRNARCRQGSGAAAGFRLAGVGRARLRARGRCGRRPTRRQSRRTPADSRDERRQRTRRPRHGVGRIAAGTAFRGPCAILSRMERCPDVWYRGCSYERVEPTQTNRGAVRRG
ncbi:MAG: LON peptidase substrate-binding domain-containing protein [Deltaproteobacteria bacterium]|nr:LON peptidase substrate-binding domain-containing protein [Deltaproteobacteria bacterium]